MYSSEASLAAFPLAQMVKNLPAMQETWDQSLGQEDPLEKEKATYSTIITWRIPWTEVCVPWDCKELDMTEGLNNSNIFICKDHFVKPTEVQEYFSMYTPVSRVTLSLRFGGFLHLSEP